MPIFYLIPGAALWLIYAVLLAFGAPWWLDYPVFGLACAATAVGGFIAFISAGTHW